MALCEYLQYESDVSSCSISSACSSVDKANSDELRRRPRTCRRNRDSPAIKQKKSTKTRKIKKRPCKNIPASKPAVLAADLAALGVEMTSSEVQHCTAQETITSLKLRIAGIIIIFQKSYPCDLLRPIEDYKNFGGTSRSLRRCLADKRASADRVAEAAIAARTN